MIRVPASCLALLLLSNNSASGQPQAYTVSVSMVKQDRHDIVFDVQKGCIGFDAKVNGKTVWMLVDNGAERSFIDTSLAKEIGLQTDILPGSVDTPAGHVPKQLVRDVKLDVPGQFTTKEPMYSVDMDRASVRFGRKIGVIIGHDLLSILAIGVNARTLFFALGGLVASGPNVGNMATLPLEHEGDMDLTTIQVNGKSVRVQIDLGYGGALRLTPEAADRLGARTNVRAAGHIIGADGKEVVTEKTTIKDVALGSFRYENVTADISPISTKVDGVLGAGVLTRQQLLLDIKGGKLYMRPF